MGPEWRSKQNTSGRASLVLVVDDLRIPFSIEDPVDSFGLRLGNHVKITIVVMPDIFMV